MISTSKVCYTCLSSDSKDLVDLTKPDRDKVNLLQKLKDCINAPLEELQTMDICKQCLKNLRIAYKFRQTVLQSQETLKSSARIVDIKDFKVEKSEDEKADVPMQSAEITVKEDIKSADSDSSSDYFLSDLASASYPDEKLEDSKDDVKGTGTRKKRKDDPNRTFNCDRCELEFNKRWVLQKHLQRAHGEEKRYICTFCDRAFKQSFHLREHITTHTGEKNYSCHFCGKLFQRMSSQKRHLKTHEAPPGSKTKRTPFLCTICGKSFPFSNGVQRHMRIHLGIRNYECKVCGRKFMQSTHLQVHMRTHTGEKPYICDTCGEAFSLNASLRKHMELHTKVKKNVAQDEEDLAASLYLVQDNS